MVISSLFVFGLLLCVMVAADVGAAPYWVGILALLACILSYLSGEGRQ